MGGQKLEGALEYANYEKKPRLGGERLIAGSCTAFDVVVDTA
jgi:hypothetical protein